MRRYEGGTYENDPDVRLHAPESADKVRREYVVTVEFTALAWDAWEAERFIRGKVLSLMPRGSGPTTDPLVIKVEEA